jgi:hypothetical protein
MSLAIELTREQEAQLAREAARAGLPLADYTKRRLMGNVLPVLVSDGALDSALDAGIGAFADVLFSADDLARQKQAEIEGEELRHQSRWSATSR